MALVSEEIEVGVAPASGVSWGAIIAGAFAAAAVSLMLMVLGSGLGLSVLSPWTLSKSSLATIAVGSVVWLIVVQWIASALGGYLAGRLRAPSGDPADEVFFRDTANGLITWALSTVLVAALLTSALSAIVGTGAQVAATIGSGAAAAAAEAGGQNTAGLLADPTAYFVDSLLRPATPSASVTIGPAADAGTGAAPPNVTGTGDVRGESGRILVNGLAAKEFPAADLAYLTALVSARTGLAPDAAKQRVDDIVQKMQTAKTDAQAAADQARKSAAKLSLFMFLSLLIGAFIAAAAAAFGGQLRDDLPRVRAR